MLKTFMQPGHSSGSKTDSSRTSHSAFASTRTTEAAKTTESARAAEAARAEAPAEAAPSARLDEGSKLIVGPNIKLKGSEITDCEILVVEGRVEASMNSRDIRIAEGGVFSGKAEIDVAEIRGTFEGELTARKRLVIYASGKVSGVIRYGAMMVEEGGILSGDVATLAAGASLARLPEAAAPAKAPEAVAEKAVELEQIHSSSAFARGQRRQG